jgi:hypothetical protein
LLVGIAAELLRFVRQNGLVDFEWDEHVLNELLRPQVASAVVLLVKMEVSRLRWLRESLPVLFLLKLSQNEEVVIVP